MICRWMCRFFSWGWPRCWLKTPDQIFGPFELNQIQSSAKYVSNMCAFLFQFGLNYSLFYFALIFNCYANVIVWSKIFGRMLNVIVFGGQSAKQTLTGTGDQTQLIFCLNFVFVHGIIKSNHHRQKVIWR